MATLQVKQDPRSPGLFNGVYSYQEAARILRVSTTRVKRWADGYTFRLKEGIGASAPILQTPRNVGVVSFDELFELMFVREYVALEVQLPHIRATAEALFESCGPLPFSSAALIVNGRELIHRTAEDVLHRPDIGQVVADFAESLARTVKFRDGLAARFHLTDHERVYSDRDIRAGQTVITKHGVPTKAVHSLWQREKNFRRVADYHDIPLIDVKAAVRYEGQWRLAA